MSLTVTEALRKGVERAVTPVGAGLLVILLGARVATAVVLDTRQPVLADAANELSGDQILESVQGPMAVDLPVAAVSALGLLGAFLTAAVVTLGFRAFTGDRPGRLPTDAWDGFAWATLNVLVAQILLSLLLGVGFVLFVLPGIIVAVAFAFVPAAIAVDDHHVVRAMLESWQTARGSLLRVFLLLLGIAAVSITVSLFGIVVGILLFGDGIGADIVTLASGALVTIYVIGVIASAFDQLRSVDDEFEDVDDDLLP
ncbi:MAG: hypothetical protein ACI9EZ_002152 [Halobacteriales archaeon]|jgi:hypothetical protein